MNIYVPNIYSHFFYKKLKENTPFNDIFLCEERLGKTKFIINDFELDSLLKILPNGSTMINIVEKPSHSHFIYVGEVFLNDFYLIKDLNHLSLNLIGDKIYFNSWIDINLVSFFDNNTKIINFKSLSSC